MIQSVQVTNHNNESIDLVLAKPELSGLIITGIEGLGPPKADINTLALANHDGSLYTGSRAQDRNIVFSLRMMDYPTIEDSRHLMYKYFPLKKNITMHFVTDRRQSTITGYVESIEPDIFSSEEAAKVSVICPDPWFYDDYSGTQSFSGTRALFEFPFSNESLEEPLLEFGIIFTDTEAVLQYVGDVDVGVLITIHITGPGVENITLYNRSTKETFEIDTVKVYTITGFSIGAGDAIVVSTYTGDKYVRLLHEGTYYNIIGAVKKDMGWFKITNGNNSFAFSAESGEENIYVEFGFRNAYGGI